MAAQTPSPTPPWALLHDAAGARWLSFPIPRRTVATHAPSEVWSALEEVRNGVVSQGLWAVGLVAYEAAPGLDRALTCHPPGGCPLLWFGLCEAPSVVPGPAVPKEETNLGGAWQPTLTDAEHAREIRRIRELIRAGDSYQVNLTYRLRQAFTGDPFGLFAHLCAAQHPRYGAYLDLGDWVVCSASPELFFLQEGDRVQCQPMKGTAARGMTLAGDQERAEALRGSQKERAENLMIVDMVRNDLGRIAEIGSVQVPELFRLEKYRTLWQLTSRVEARTRADPLEVLAALFPAASITGAPKRRTMDIIAELETGPRGLYTGTIGFLAPGRRAQFNVAIRTAVLDRGSGWLEYGTGGGIVWDSEPELELTESRTKARILTEPLPPPFSLLETLRWTPAEGYFLLDRHLSRLADSARYFDYACDIGLVADRLGALARGLPPRPMRIRLLLDPDGAIHLEARPLEAEGDRVWRVALATTPVRRDDPFLYHKTSHRRLYDAARAAAPGYDDVILFNDRGEVTESCIANLILEIGGERYTPPLDCGLLGGTYRAELLAQGAIRERPIPIEELRRHPRLWLANSVRGLFPAVLADDPGP